MRQILVIWLLLCAGLLLAQTTLQVNGLNEAQLVYRDVPDSLRMYFKDSFSFNLAYRGFGFGMKFISELPKYRSSQSDLLDELEAKDLKVGFDELYVSYESGPWMVKSGTLYETFGSGMVFRSYEDKEFDQDHRIKGFQFKYDDLFRLKAIYGGISSPNDANALDLSYGVDIEYPGSFYKIAAGAVGFRNKTAFGYDQSDVFFARLGFNYSSFSFWSEAAMRELYHRGSPALKPVSGKAFIAGADYSLGPVLVGAAFKNYDQFQYRQQDVFLANYHGETLADSQASALDEQGVQGWIGWDISDNWNVEANYAEAWSSDDLRKMNDLFGALEYSGDALSAGLEWSHIEKTGSEPGAMGQLNHYWQKEVTPALNLGFDVCSKPLSLKTEFKLVEKENINTGYETVSHYEPRIQADIALGKVSLSAATGSKWEGFDSLMDSRYWANMEAKIGLFDHSELLVFAGSEAGGKVCRNGMCRFVAPFSGLRVELSTRF